MGAQPSTIKKKSFLRTSLIKKKPAGKLSTKTSPVQIQRNIEKQDLLRLLSIKMIQSKLRIGQPGDIYEQEADRMANLVISLPLPDYDQIRDDDNLEPVISEPLATEITPVIQREQEEEKEKEEEKNEVVQTKLYDFDGTIVQRQDELEEEKEKEENDLVQTKWSVTGEPILQREESLKEEPEEKEEEEKLVQPDFKFFDRPIFQRKEKEEEDQEEEVVQTALMSHNYPALQRKEKEEEKEEEKTVQKFYIQREEAKKDEEEEKLQKLPLNDRKLDEKDEIKTKAGAGKKGASNIDKAEHLIRDKSPGSPIPSDTRNRLETHFGADLSDVQVHTDSKAHQASELLHARAFTHKNHIWLAQGESPNDLKLMAHETTHVIQQRAAPISKSSSNATAKPNSTKGSNFVQRKWFGIDKLGKAIWDKTGGKLLDEMGNVIEMGKDFMWAVIDKYAPKEFAKLLREISAKGGIIQFLKGKIIDAFKTIFNKLEDQGGIIAEVTIIFRGLLKKVGEILKLLGTDKCKELYASVRELGVALKLLAGRVWEKIKNFFRPVGDFFTKLWKAFGAPLVEWIKDFHVGIWDYIKNLGAKIWAFTRPIRVKLGKLWSKVWNWTKETLGLGKEKKEEEENEGGLINWIKETAGKVWEDIKGEFKAALAPVKILVEKVKAIYQLKPIQDAKKKIQKWLNKVGSMAQTMEKENGVADEQISLRDEILPAVLESIQSLRESLMSAGEWVSDKIGVLSVKIYDFVDNLKKHPILNKVSDVFNWLKSGIAQLKTWAQDTVITLFDMVGTGLVKLSKFIEPVLNLLKDLVAVYLDLMTLLPKFILGKLWKMVPFCIREPIKNFIIEKILKQIPIFNQILAIKNIWEKLKDTALRILKKVFVEGDLFGAAWTFFKFVLEAFDVPPELVTDLLKKAAKVMGDILNDPFGFLTNLLKALKLGFVKFFGKIGKYLLKGVKDWLFGQVSKAGIEAPKDLSLKSILKLVLDILDITKERIFTRLEKKLGKKTVDKIRKTLKILEGVWEWVSILIKEGPAGIWRKITEKIKSLWQKVFSAAINWITKTIIKKVMEKILTMLDPTGIMAVVNSIIAFYRAVQSFFDYLKEMLEIANSVLDGIAEIVKGVISKAAKFVEKNLAKSLPVAIGFLANQLGLGNLGKRIKEIIEAIRGYVDMGIDWLIDKALSLGKWIFDKIKGVAGKVKEWWKERKKIKQGEEVHTLFFEGEGENAKLMIETTKKPLSDYLKQMRSKELTSKQEKILEKIETLTDDIKKIKSTKKIKEKQGKEIAEKFSKIADLMEKLVIGTDTNIRPKSQVTFRARKWRGDNDGEYMVAQPLSIRAGRYTGSEPYEDSKLWKKVKVRNETQNNTYVRAHLLNHHLHGPGINKNLTPMPGGDNTRMESKFESEVKKVVLQDNKVVSYIVQMVHGWNVKRTWIPEEADLVRKVILKAYYMKPKEDIKTEPEKIKEPGNWEIDKNKEKIFDDEMEIQKLPEDVEVGKLVVNLNNSSAYKLSKVMGISGTYARIIEKRRSIEIFENISNFNDRMKKWEEEAPKKRYKKDVVFDEERKNVIRAFNEEKVRF